jgi:hypothetical protein
MEIGRQRAQGIVNRVFERIIEARRRTRIHLNKDARIGADAFPLLGVGQFIDLVGLCALGCSVAAAPSRTKRPLTSSPH